MSDTVDRALDLWGLAGADVRLVAARENAVYKITQGPHSLALRLHRQGYRTDAELASELAWMAGVDALGLGVPKPLLSTDGTFLQVIDGTQVDVLSWLEGETLDGALANENTDTRARYLGALGAELARLHDASDRWVPPPEFQRCHWHRDGLLGDAPLWGRFWENPGLSKDDRKLFVKFRQVADDALRNYGTQLDYGLIHADPVAANVMVSDGRLCLIDFDDGGYGYRLFDIATALIKHMSAPDFPALRIALLDGYVCTRRIDLSHLGLFLALRAVTYVGWNIARMEEDAAQERNKRYIEQARNLVLNWLSAA